MRSLFFSLLTSIFCSVLVLSGCASQPSVEPELGIETQEIKYNVGDVELTGFMAYPKGKDNLPGVLIVHEWWGHNAYTRKRAEMLAEEGYAAFALDMYGDGKLAQHPSKASEFMMEVLGQDGAVLERFTAALELLKQSPMTDDDKIAAIGYCFGGAVVLSMARAGVDLDGVVSFHGSLQNLAPIAPSVDTEFLVLNGADDPFVKQEQIIQFKDEMDAAKLDYEFVNYPGAVHAFTNPDATAKGEEFNLPLRYNAEADSDSWERMKSFLKSVF